MDAVRQQRHGSGVSRVISPGGESVGKAVDQVEQGYLVALGGTFKRTYRVVPRRHLWERPGEGKLMLVVPVQKVLDGPEADREGRVDAAAFDRYWAEED
jgi:hypothetical protein